MWLRVHRLSSLCFVVLHIPHKFFRRVATPFTRYFRSGITLSVVDPFLVQNSPILCSRHFTYDRGQGVQQAAGKERFIIYNRLSRCCEGEAATVPLSDPTVKIAEVNSRAHVKERFLTLHSLLYSMSLYVHIQRETLPRADV